MRYKAVTVDQERLANLVKQWAVAWALCGLLFGLDQIGQLTWFRGGIERGFSIIDHQILKITTWIFTPVTLIQTAWNRTERIADLEERLAHTAVERAKLSELEDKIVTLEALATYQTQNIKASQVVKLVDYGDRVVLAIGAAEGVRVGQVVTDKSFVLLGKVKEVGTYLSELELLDDLGSTVAVSISGGSAHGMIQGKGGRSELTGVLQSETVMIHDVLVTSGKDGVYPPGLVIGQVIDLMGQPEDVTKGGIVELLAKRDEWVILW